MDGWIKLHRSIRSHWLYSSKKAKTRREAWEDILMLVNYEPKKVLIRGQLYDCDRGQSLFSLENWAKEFNWSVQQVRTFFKLLENDKMITIEGMQYTTRLTVCNYDCYQGLVTDEQHTNEQTNNRPLTDEQQTANRRLTTTKEREERKKEKKEKNNTPELSDENSEHTLGFSLKEFKGKEIEKIDIQTLPDEYKQSHSIACGFYSLFKEINQKLGLSSSNIKTAKFDGYTLEIFRMIKQGEANRDTLAGVYAYLKWEQENVEADKFRWCEQVRSCSNLRKHYSQIFTAMKKAQIKLNGKSQNWDEIDNYLKEHKVTIVNTKRL